jgi:hypothetical protein
VDDPLTVLVAARDEEARIAQTVAALRRSFPDGEVIVADDGSRDRTADVAEAAGAIVLRLPRFGKGQALSAAERAASPGRLLLCEPLSGQRSLSVRARRSCFPLASGFGCEVRMTIDAVHSHLRIEEIELPLRHRATGRDARGFLHRARQLLDALLAAGPLAVNYRGNRLPLVGWTLALRREPAIAAVAAIGLADDLWSGPERGFRAHLRAGRTTGVLKLLGIPLVAFAATRRLSGTILVGLAANVLNQLDTRPGRALKAYVAAAFALDAPLGVAVLLLPYDLREMAMLGDAGANALGAMLGLKSVERFTGRGRWVAIGALAGLTVLGERTSLGDVIERTPGLAQLDRVGRR